VLARVLCAALAVLACAPAAAAPEHVCNAYAQAAVAAQQYNLANACGLAGDRWSLDFGGHKAWCLGVDQPLLDQESNARNGDIARCNTCIGYAQAAVAAQQQNVGSGCALVGDRWSFDFNGHRAWCMSAPQSARDAESNARQHELAKCTSCFAYAQQATGAQQLNLANGCGLAGDRWSLNFDGHRSWCMGAPQAAIDGEAAARRAELDRCTACTAYAQEAVSAQYQNLAQCQFVGDRWSLDFTGHRAWCMGATPDAVAGETSARRFALERCAGRCRAYTLAALDAQRKNIENQCGFTGERWSLDATGHMTWCVGAPPASIDYEEGERAKMIAACLSPGRRAACEAYAGNAIAQFERARGRAGCDYSDQRRWHGNRPNHYNWCMAVAVGLPPAETDARDRELARCASASPPDAGPTGSEQCLVSVRVRNGECINLVGGTSSEILLPGTRSAVGCGGDQDLASERAKLLLQATGVCLSEGDEPEPGCCTFTEEVVQGCLCGQ
jgi:hypothetical protein